MLTMAIAISSLSFSQTKSTSDTLKTNLHLIKAKIQPDYAPDAKKEKKSEINNISEESQKLSATEHKKRQKKQK